MDDDNRTPTQKLADVLLAADGGLEKFIRDRRAAGRSWRLISRDLLTATGGTIDVTIESIRRWYPDPPGASGDEAAA